MEAHALVGKAVFRRESALLGRLLEIFITILYYIALYYPVMGQRLLELLVFLACLLKL